MNWTEEQQAIIRSRAPRLVARAFAGTGKTATAIGYTQARPQTRFLYLVFNKSAQIEAQQRFPKNVVVKTGHSLAYAHQGRAYRHKLRSGIRASELRAAVDPGWAMNYPALMDVKATLKAFLQSPDPEPQTSHARKAIGAERGSKASRFAELADKLWRKMLNPGDEQVPMTHEGYLKAFQLSNPDLSSRFDHIIVDEAQDLNPVTKAIIEKQKVPVMLIGDEHQSIYRFRGAVNAMATFDAHESLSLTNSFRFGFRPATLANGLLQHYKAESECLLGMGPDTEIITGTSADHKATWIHRTFAETFASAALAASKGKKIEWIGGIDAYPLDDITDLYHLYAENHDQIQDRRLLADFPEYQAYKESAEEIGDPEMLRLIKIIGQHGARIPQLVQAMKGEAVDNLRADISLTTAHRSKGLQWGSVVLAQDFPDLDDPEKSDMEVIDEANLIYVALTRAERSMTLSAEIQKMVMMPPITRQGAELSLV